MPLVAATRAKQDPNLLSRSRRRYFGDRPKGVASRSCWAVHVSVGERVTPTWITLRECSSMMKKAKSERKNRSVTGRKSQAPDLLDMSMNECPPCLSSGPGGTDLPHVLLNGALADADAQFEQFASDAF